MAAARLVLTSAQMLDAVRQLDGVRVPLSVLSYWATHDVVVPSVQHTGKRGPGGRLYSLADLAKLRLVVRLRQQGLSVPRVRVILGFIKTQLPDLLTRRSQAALLVDGWRGVIVRRPGHPAQHVPSGQLLLPLSEVRADAREVQRIIAA